MPMERGTSNRVRARGAIWLLLAGRPNFTLCVLTACLVVRFLDFIIDMFDPDRRPGGIFGQSAHPPPGSRRLGIEWDYEGVADDYETEDLFGTNFVFNQFEG